MSDGVRYCKRCAAEIDASDAFCSTCGAELDGDPPIPDGAPSGRWWLALAVHPILAVVGFALGYAGVADLGLGVDAVGVLVGVVLAPLAVHFDGRHLAARRASWTPSRWFYLALIPYLGILVALLYVVKRRRAVA